MPKYTTIIGMEIHVELKTKSKMFCACANNPDRDAPNTNICEICLAHPGTLPVPNQTAIEWTAKIARALGCRVNELSKFDRKHYFYPDLPKGYQISQYDQPIGEHGGITLQFLTGKNHREVAKIGITRVHLEEDTAKSTHQGAGHTLIDYNRAGVPLVESVSDPDIQSASEAKAYCQELQAIFRYLGVSEANMEKGQMRCEANVSVQEEGKFVIEGGVVRPLGDYILNNKIELKNINSFRAIELAIEYEVKRQTALAEKGIAWGMETRGWNDAKGESVLQRVKETAADYRYFPEPDIPPFHPAKLAGKINLLELPQQKRRRFHEEYGFSYADAYILTADRDWANFTEQVMSELAEWVNSLSKNDEPIEILNQKLAKLAGGWITTKLTGAMADRKIDIRILKITPENFAELITLIQTNRVNSTNAQKILADMLDTGTDIDPTHIMEDKGYGQITDEKQLSAIVDEVIKNNPKQAEAYRAGKIPLLQFLKGMVMKATEGAADPQVAEELLKKKLNG
ncbi:MAG: Asp-tRNA(Asn)/Glu-tRNA(Gln) amidotransferase subunit GatB [bacterium]|nr:Asp-tRNA(Asn)/Glu-tRNA(Gln) amidotransferase subunit GatB [bacterium]